MKMLTDMGLAATDTTELAELVARYEHLEGLREQHGDLFATRFTIDTAAHELLEDVHDSSLVSSVVASLTGALDPYPRPATDAGNQSGGDPSNAAMSAGQAARYNTANAAAGAGGSGAGSGGEGYWGAWWRGFCEGLADPETIAGQSFTGDIHTGGSDLLLGRFGGHHTHFGASCGNTRCDPM